VARYKKERYSLPELAVLHAEGRLSDKSYRRAGGRVCGPDEINDPVYQADATRSTGLPKTQQYGPADLGHLDSGINRRSFPKESRTGKPVKTERLPAFKTNWYSAGPGRET
jgi:hypothetical protein